MKDYPGIPREIDLEFVAEWVRPRVSQKRFDHIVGVAVVAGRLAKKAECSVFLARLSGWLHDACKEVKDKRLVELAREYDIPLDEILSQHGHLLHGPVAAETVKRELKITNSDVYHAIAEHTLGAVPMSELSKVMYLADCLEESRPKSYTQPIWNALDMDGEFNMDAAIVVASDEGLKFLIEQGKPIHPKTIDVRNYYLAAVKKRQESKRA